MYRCRECGAVFEEPNYMEVCFEDECGVSGMFRDRHYGVRAECPECGMRIDEYDIYYEEDEDDYE